MNESVLDLSQKSDFVKLLTRKNKLHILSTFHLTMYRKFGTECKKRLFHTSKTYYRNVRPGFFTSLLNSTDGCTRQPKEVLSAYPIVTSKEARSNETPPVSSKMLVREFIDDSLYNPHYGFYSKSSISPYSEFEEMEQEEDHMQYMRRIARLRGRVHHHNIQQFRYTLTELFKVRIV
jgi:hypothetical protein